MKLINSVPERKKKKKGKPENFRRADIGKKPQEHTGILNSFISKYRTILMLAVTLGISVGAIGLYKTYNSVSVSQSVDQMQEETDEAVLDNAIAHFESEFGNFKKMLIERGGDLEGRSIHAPFELFEKNLEFEYRNLFKFNRTHEAVNGHRNSGSNIYFFYAVQESLVNSKGYSSQFNMLSRSFFLPPDFDHNNIYNLLVASYELVHGIQDGIRRNSYTTIDQAQEGASFIEHSIIINLEYQAYSIEMDILDTLFKGKLKEKKGIITFQEFMDDLIAMGFEIRPDQIDFMRGGTFQIMKVYFGGSSPDDTGYPSAFTKLIDEQYKNRGFNEYRADPKTGQLTKIN